MRKHLLPRLALGTALGLAFIASPQTRGDDFVRDSIPNKWIAPLVPEDMEKLDYPSYFKDIDKARLEAHTGRYKLALLTLKKVKDGDPVQVALVKATALAATGRKDEALQALTADPKAAADVKAQVMRARILS